MSRAHLPSFRQKAAASADSDRPLSSLSFRCTLEMADRTSGFESHPIRDLVAPCGVAYDRGRIGDEGRGRM
jgi:hypothetical protein